MKGVAIVALFAFVAVQLCHAAPMPDEEKKEEVSAAPVVAEVSSVPAEVEVKSESPKAEVSVVPAEAPAKVEEKKA